MILYVIVPLAICIFNVLFIIAILREQEKSVRINNAYYHAYRRLEDLSLFYVTNYGTDTQIQKLKQLLRKDGELILEAHRKVPTFNRNTSI